jgi:hypothetical protein
LLQEDVQLRGIPFREVIFDATGKRVPAYNPKDEVGARVIKQISARSRRGDEASKRARQPDSGDSAH